MKRLVHAVLRVKNREGPDPELPAGLSSLISGDLAVAFRRLAVDAIAPTVPQLEAFAKAVAEIHRKSATIPFRFGCTVESDARLEALLSDHRVAWNSMLDRVEQCDEYSVHLPGPPGAPMDQDQSERISDPQQVVSSTDRPGTRYLLARRQGVHRASAVRSKALARAELLRPGLDGLHRGCEINPPISGQETLVTLVFLVPAPRPRRLSPRWKLPAVPVSAR